MKLPAAPAASALAALQQIAGIASFAEDGDSTRAALFDRAQEIANATLSALAGSAAPPHDGEKSLAVLRTYIAAGQPGIVMLDLESVAALVAKVDVARAEADRWRGQAFMPLGDNHHNALLCPHCNPKGQRFAAEAMTHA